MINVISLFDGMGIGLLALINAGKRNFNYYRVEIDKNVNKAFFHFFNEDFLNKYNIKVYHHDDVKTFPDSITADKLKEEGVYLLLGGSPCTNLSFCGKQEGLINGKQSSLFFDYVRIKDFFNPKYFFLENTPMKKEYSNIITAKLGCGYMMINSSDFTAQCRKRLYWTNIYYDFYEHVKNTDTVEDILEEEVDDKYYIDPKQAVIICDNECKKHKIAYIGTDKSANRIYNINGKSVTLIANGGGCGAKTGLYAIPCMNPDLVVKKQNGIRFKEPFSKFYTLTTIDKHGILIGNYIRKLTPVECERLQGWPDNMTIGAGSDSARYKICGNGWTEPVIRHILKFLP